MQPDAVDLFLFSAAIGLPHRIHYDSNYARDEGYRDTVVHGPLQGAWLGNVLGEWARAQGGRLSWMEYRHLNPAYSGERLTVSAVVSDPDPSPPRMRVELRIETDDGTVTTEGEAYLEWPTEPILRVRLPGREVDCGR